MSKDEFLIFVIICAILVIAVLIYILYRILRNLFVYPYFVYSVVCPENENVSRLPYFFLDSETEFERTDGAFEQYSSEI